MRPPGRSSRGERHKVFVDDQKLEAEQWLDELHETTGINRTLLKRYKDRVKSTAFVDHSVLEAVLLRRELQDTIGEYLSQYHWSLFFTGTFESDLDEAAAEQAARLWVAQFKHAYAWMAVEVGHNGDHKTHVHMLLGGFARPWDKRAAKWFWEREFGNAKVERYNHKQNGRFYVGKEPGTGVPVGRFKKHRARRRGPKKPRS